MLNRSSPFVEMPVSPGATKKVFQGWFEAYPPCISMCCVVRSPHWVVRLVASGHSAAAMDPVSVRPLQSPPRRHFSSEPPRYTRLAIRMIVLEGGLDAGGTKIAAAGNFLVSVYGQYLLLSFSPEGATERSGFNYLSFGIRLGGFF